MTHCTMDDLLALRANEGSVWARKHLESCTECQQGLEALYQRVAQLKALPPRAPSRDAWPAIRAAVLEERHRRRRRWTGWSLAAAATVAGLMIFRPFMPATASADELAQAQHTSAQLESTLRQYQPEGRVERGRAAALAAQIEDQLAVIDGQLAQAGPTRPDALLELWQERVNLMHQLVQVRVVRASYVGL
jgi:hypothetical protein